MEGLIFGILRYAISKHIWNMPSVDIFVNPLKCGDKSLFTPAGSLCL